MERQKALRALFLVGSIWLLGLVVILAVEYSTSAIYDWGIALPFSTPYHPSGVVNLGAQYVGDLVVWWGAAAFIGAHTIRTFKPRS
jgi:hypothetical protein